MICNSLHLMNLGTEPPELIHRRSQYEANRGTRLGKILPNTVDFYFFIRLIILEDFIRLISYNGPCVRLGCSFLLATALLLDLVENMLTI